MEYSGLRKVKGRASKSFGKRNLFGFFLASGLIAIAIWFALIPKAMTSFMSNSSTINVFAADESVESWISRANYQSDFLVVNTLYEIRENGLFHNQLAIGTYPGYNSQFGLGSWLTTAPLTSGLIPDSWFRVNENLKPEFSGYRDYSRVVKLLFLITIGINSSVIAAIVFGIRSLLGTAPAVVATVSFLSPWGTAFFGSIYSQIWIKLLPALIITFLGPRLWRSNRKKLLHCLVFASVVLVALSGYEYITVTFACAVAATVLSSTLLRENIRETRKKFLELFILFATAFFMGVLIHIMQLWIKTGSLGLAGTMFVELVSKRSGGNFATVDPVFETSLASDPAQVLELYLQLSPLADPLSIPVLDSFNMLTFLIVTGLIASKYASRVTTDAVGAKAVSLAWMVTAFGPISWFTLSRPHSQIHTFINPWLWWVPVVPVGLALITYSIKHELFFNNQIPSSTRRRSFLFFLILAPFSLLLLSYGLRAFS